MPHHIAQLNVGLKLNPQNPFFRQLLKTQEQQLKTVNGLLGEPASK